MKKYILLLLAGVTLAISSCTKQHLEPVITPETLKDIALGSDTLTMYVGQDAHINLKLTPFDYDKKSLVWKSSDTTVISVIDTATIKAKKVGLSTITVSNKNNTVSVSCLVSVIAPPVKPVVDSLKIGLLVYFPFNNSGVDSSGKGNDGKIHEISSVYNRFNKPNSAYYFNGVTSYIKVKDNEALRLSNTNFTLNVWIKLEDYNSSFGSAILLKRLTDADNGWNFSVRGYGGAPAGIVTFGPGGGSFNAFGNTAVGLGKWSMVSGVYNLARHELSIYVNGVLDSKVEGILSPNASITSPLYIGKDDPNVPANGYFFKGTMDDIRIYNRELTSKEITKLYNLTY